MILVVKSIHYWFHSEKYCFEIFASISSTVSYNFCIDHFIVYSDFVEINTSKSSFRSGDKKFQDHVKARSNLI